MCYFWELNFKKSVLGELMIKFHIFYNFSSLRFSLGNVKFQENTIKKIVFHALPPLTHFTALGVEF